MSAFTPLPAQTHKVSKPETVVRAVGVYEWTGDMAKPAASRLIPVSLFIDGRLQDAGVYLAAPVPMALLTGNVYQLQKSGTLIGDLDLAFARHLVVSAESTTTYDDGWFGYGKFVPPAAPKKSTLKASTTMAKINGIDMDDDKPHFSSRSAVPGSGGSAAPTVSSTTAPTETPATDPDRPTLHRPLSSAGSGSSGGSGSSSGSGSAPVDDPDRPTLRRRSPEEANDAKSAKAGKNSVSAVANGLNDDPNRPTLHRGKPTSAMSETDIPKLSGLPGDHDLQQMVAVSDAQDHPSHDFARAWDDENEHQAILAKMQSVAREQLAAYEAANGTARAVAVLTPSTKTAAPKTPAEAARARRAAAKPMPPPPTPPVALMEEKLVGYTLSYGGAPTYVYYAHTDGLGSAERFVTLVAQVNMQGEPEIALKNVTDAAHLDRTPRMRLVDAVDAEASNRASLLFELRAQNSRQFALYRVIGAQAAQTFLTGSTQ
ncbi:MAG: hypothetical protein M3O31_01060 [Acidobacteriota bacterium]|nr:hypothetical protein [Acidobacteriota bacterium]